MPAALAIKDVNCNCFFRENRATLIARFAWTACGPALRITLA